MSVTRGGGPGAGAFPGVCQGTSIQGWDWARPRLVVLCPSFLLHVRNSWAPGVRNSQNHQITPGRLLGGLFWEFSFLLSYQRFFCRCVKLLPLVFTRHFSCSYAVISFCEQNSTHLALLPVAEIGVFRRYCTDFPAAHSFVGDKPAGPVGWKSLRCCVVFNISLDL